ncbi:MAG: EamA family transporter [Chthoniobacterales bacterium]
MNNWLTWALCSAFFAGLTAVLAKIGVEGINSNLATAIRTTVILLFTWALAAYTASPISFENISRRTWLFLLLSGLATGISWICYFRALQLGQASQVAPIDKLSILFVIAFAALFLGERITWHHWVGGVLILVGAAILSTR